RRPYPRGPIPFIIDGSESERARDVDPLGPRSRLPLSPSLRLGRPRRPDSIRSDPGDRRHVANPKWSMMVGRKLYVGNLAYQVRDSELEELFSEFGTVQSAQVIHDRYTGRSKGFGFVEMGSEAEAQAAIQGLHDQEVNGRRLTVNEAKPREPRS